MILSFIMEKDDFSVSKKFIVISLIFTIYKLFLAYQLDLTPDEAYYWEFSRRLDLSYYDHPPMVGYMIFISRLIFGDTNFGVRIFSCLTTLLVSYLIYILGKKLAGENAGLGATFIFQSSASGMAIGFIMTPDTPLSLFWALGIILALKVYQTDRPVWWILLGATVGAGGLAKYNMIFFGFGVLLVLFSFSDLRNKLLSRNIVVSLIFVFLFLLPVFIWNAQNDWISFKFQLNHGFKSTNRAMIHNIGEFIGGQMATVGPVVFCLSVFYIVSSLLNGYKNRNIFLFSMGGFAFPILVFFFYSGLNSKVEANWPQMAYLTGIPLAATYIFQNPISWKRVILCVLPTSFIGILASIHVQTLILPVRPDYDISSRLHGWQEMGKMIREAVEKLDNPFVIVQGNTLTSLTGFYGKIDKDRIVEIHLKNNWKFWCRNFSLPIGANAVYIDENNWSCLNEQIPFFEKKGNASVCEIFYAGKKLRTINITPLINHKGGFAPKPQQ
ncbi:MAG: glycosyltransferase family 39 protein [Candidatus Riflebacteria bacterium]|nr:glycosyltransferase family 39 protein [Candidatus Riflebacteria bacterium]